MKYSINYSRDFRHYNEVDEVIIEIKDKQQDFVTFILSLVETNPKLKIVLNISKFMAEIDYPDLIPAIKVLKEENNINVVVKIPEPGCNVDKFLVEGIPFFYAKVATKVEDVYVQMKMGATEVYIAEELGFRLKELQYFREEYGIEFRVYPNIAQSVNKTIIDGMTRFWIRPEDTEIYEPYIDTFEILGGVNELRASVIYEIYKQQQWLGNLNDVILDFDTPIVNNRGLNPHFAEVRLNCGKKCLLGKCNLCEQMGNLANKFTEVGIEVIKPRVKQEISEDERELIMKKLMERTNESRTDKETV